MKFSGLDRFGTVFDQINWDAGPVGVFFHMSCVKSMQTKKTLEKALKRKKLEIKVKNKEENVSEELEMVMPENTGKIVTHKSVGPLQKKDLCVWCMQPPETTKKKMSSPFRLIQQLDAWKRFNTVYLEDGAMCERIVKLINATTDPFATEIYYHEKCWKKYMKKTYLQEDEKIHAGNIRPEEANQMFLNHVSKIIFELNEPRTLQGLLLDYKNIAENFLISTEKIKTSTIKEILAKEFHSKIGFYNRFRKNKSTIEYDSSQGSSFIEAAVNAWGISDEQLINLLAKRMIANVKEEDVMKWPPTLEEMKSEEASSDILTKFLLQLKKHPNKEKNKCMEPDIHFISSILKSLITGKRTILKTILSCTLYGLTRSKEIINLTQKFGVGISYQDIKNLYATWASHEIQNESCPQN